MAAVAEPPRKPGRPKDPDLETRRKAEILDAAAVVFAKDGFADADVQFIADRVGVSKGTVYRYFETKDALFLAAVDRGLKELSAACDAALLDDAVKPLERVERAVVAYLTFFHRRPEMAELFVQERAAFRDRRKPLYFDTHGECADRDLEFVRHLMAAGVFRAADARQVMDVFGDLLFGTILSNHLAGRRVRPETQAQSILDVMFHGLLSDAERKRRDSKGTRSPVKPHAVVFLAVALGLAGCAPAESTLKAPPEVPPVPVAVTPVTLRTVPRTIAAVGTLNGWEEVMIAPKGEGRVVAVRADVGDRVLPGSTLLELDPTDARLAVSEGKRALEAELARLGLTAIPAGSFDVEAVPGVRTATVAVLDAKRRLKQKEDLKGAGSPDEIEIAQTDLKLAEARKAQAQTEAEASLAAARMRRAQLDTAEQRLRDCVVEAPVPDGFLPWAAAVGPAFVPIRYAVAQRLTAEGEMIRAMPVTNAFKLVLDYTLKLKVQVPEQAAAGVQVGQTVELRVDAFPNRTFPGRVARVNPTVDPLNRTFSVEIEVPNASGTLKAGGFAKATLRSRTDANVVTVPPEAVVSFAGVTKVFLLDGDTAKAVEIKTGTRDKGWVELIGPVPPDSKVIVSGLSQVVDGSVVKVR
jgi:multidrug efflux pump subunit AcrA (membrane-fusion protein)/AcrR family transcriptional regulator